jgi:hypothetical protein
MSQPGLDYPYGSSPLRPQWRDRWARGLAALVLSGMAISLFAHRSVWPVDRIALMIVLPALLGITLAFAPDPPALISRLAKRLTVAGCAIAPFAGTLLAPMILAVPALLALSVAVGTVWEDRRNG